MQNGSDKWEKDNRYISIILPFFLDPQLLYFWSALYGINFTFSRPTLSTPSRSQAGKVRTPHRKPGPKSSQVHPWQFYVDSALSKQTTKLNSKHLRQSKWYWKYASKNFQSQFWKTWDKPVACSHPSLHSQEAQQLHFLAKCYNLMNLKKKNYNLMILKKCYNLMNLNHLQYHHHLHHSINTLASQNQLINTIVNQHHR